MKVLYTKKEKFATEIVYAQGTILKYSPFLELFQFKKKIQLVRQKIHITPF